MKELEVFRVEDGVGVGGVFILFFILMMLLGLCVGVFCGLVMVGLGGLGMVF